MEIRYIEKTDDRYAISRIYEESWKFAYKDIIPQSYLDSIPSGQWASKIDNPEMYSAVAVECGKLIGTSSFCKSRFSEYADFGEIVSVYLLPEYIGKGYGRKLLWFAVNALSELGYRDVFLWVLEDNKRARAFYEKCGFVYSNTYLNDNIGGKELRELQYRYHIA